MVEWKAYTWAGRGTLASSTHATVLRSHSYGITQHSESDEGEACRLSENLPMARYDGEVIAL